MVQPPMARVMDALGTTEEQFLARRAALDPTWDAKLRALAAVRAGAPLMPPAGGGQPTLESVLNAARVANPNVRPQVMPPWIGVRG